MSELEHLTKAPKGRQKIYYYDPTWEYCKNYTKEKLSDLELKDMMNSEKIGVESVFGKLKGDFVFHRVRD
ncbi:hypothetical protein FD11_GL001131 [Ligilactobacillus pobuzihii E100301 = KCTC 13174]|uniref:Transposase DDE domain-containing protein n=2 Tax=Ligilactobacillus pobuzihii TaxID=449659 RepID=A0A0R2L9F7_9LACO|nr:hypothetical protein FD11_GL001131 [Ligilactobacillus pobuzihii E100301 = KCTC 13174]KRN98495.1 hypothetical protein IV66_GL001825 [Ligilactobacillus pobuzihii]GEN48520.1 hypothetical protein LPO01_13120 [Ligilactobacillus pobuzihii]